MSDYLNYEPRHEIEEPINYSRGDNLQVTSITDLQSYSKGTVVRFPDFGENQPFVARVRRPSLLILAKSGKIPNTLLSTANKLFTGDSDTNVNENMLSDTYDVCRIICEASLISPTLKEIEDAGMKLSDDQMMAIFNYAQAGARALDSFR